MENGDVIPCEFERNFKYGNIREYSINEILNKEETISKWNLNFDKIETCKDCEYRYACKDCRALGLSVCGSMTSKNPRCLYDPYQGVWNDYEN
jgi:radical SAM protein with 4Fe4S-binding SPASM domain